MPSDLLEAAADRIRFGQVETILPDHVEILQRAARLELGQSGSDRCIDRKPVDQPLDGLQVDRIERHLRALRSAGPVAHARVADVGRRQAHTVGRGEHESARPQLEAVLRLRASPADRAAP